MLQTYVLPCAIALGIFLLVAAVWFFAWYFYYRWKLTRAAMDEIAQLESEAMENADKMNSLVSALYSMLPAPLKKIFGENMVAELSQSVFDAMKRYALERAKAKTEELKEEEAQEGEKETEEAWEQGEEIEEQAQTGEETKEGQT